MHNLYFSQGIYTWLDTGTTEVVRAYWKAIETCVVAEMKEQTLGFANFAP